MNPDSLHYLGQDQNQYEQALRQVGEVLEPYDSDKMIPTFGFGGSPQYIWAQSLTSDEKLRLKDCFPLNGNILDPEINGLQQLLQQYRSHLQEIKFSGPTLFAPILREFIKSSQASSFNQQIFNILLVLTDGDIHDMRETKSLIVAASELPCAIVIVGLGNHNFVDMEVLDGDDGLLRDDFGKVAKRDIVQFINFKEVQHSQHALAEAVLKEIPDQVVGYMESHNIKPKKVMVDIGSYFQKLTKLTKAQLPQTKPNNNPEITKEPESIQ